MKAFGSCSASSSSRFLLSDKDSSGGAGGACTVRGLGEEVVLSSSRSAASVAAGEAPLSSFFEPFPRTGEGFVNFAKFGCGDAPIVAGVVGEAVFAGLPVVAPEAVRRCFIGGGLKSSTRRLFF